MSQSTIAQPTARRHAPHRTSALLVAVIALVATLAIAVAVFAWTTAGRSEPSPPTLPSVESDQPTTDAEVIPADGIPVLHENCLPRQACAF